MMNVIVDHLLVSDHYGELFSVLLQWGRRTVELQWHSTVPGDVEHGRRQPQSTRMLSSYNYTGWVHLSIRKKIRTFL